MITYALAHGARIGGHEGWGGVGGHHLAGAIFAGILWAAALAALVVLVVYLIKRMSSHPPATLAGPTEGAAESPLEVLKMRYARGEIDKADFEDRKKDLT